MSDVDEFFEKVGTKIPESEWIDLTYKHVRCPHCKRTSKLKKRHYIDIDVEDKKSNG